MLKFLMYKLESILSEDKFRDIMSEFSIATAQEWVHHVKDVIGVQRYDEIKREFRAEQETEQTRLSEMNCFAKRKASVNRQTIFQISIGAEKRVDADGEGVDSLFTQFFSGI